MSCNLSNGCNINGGHVVKLDSESLQVTNKWCGYWNNGNGKEFRRENPQFKKFFHKDGSLCDVSNVSGDGGGSSNSRSSNGCDMKSEAVGTKCKVHGGNIKKTGDKELTVTNKWCGYWNNDLMKDWREDYSGFTFKHKKGGEC